MKYSIGFFAHGPGSANALHPLIKKLQKDYDIKLFSFHPYVSQLWEAELRLENDYLNIFEETVDILFYGTGSGHDMERLIPFYAQQKDIVTISVLDIFWLDVENLKMRFPTPPNYLIVPTGDVFNMACEANVLPSSNIFSFGNPHFDRLRDYSSHSKLLNPPYSIAFFSQPSTTGDLSDTCPKCKQSITDLMEIHKERSDLIKNIIIKAHPRESLDWLKSIQEGSVILDVHTDSFNILLATDLNVGVNCTLQYESTIVGKPTVFFSNKEHLLNSLINLSENSQINTYYGDFNATNHIIQWLQEEILL